MQLTTIRELEYKTKLNDQQIRVLLKNNEIEPVDRNKHKINGFTGHAYYFEECYKIITRYLKQREQPHKVIKKYSNEFVCETLRKNVRSYLNGKEIPIWNSNDWKNFEAIKNSN